MLRQLSRRCRNTKLSETIVTYMYNSDDATMQTIKIVNSHYITEGQYVAIIACIIYMYKGHISNFFVRNYWGNRARRSGLG